MRSTQHAFTWIMVVGLALPVGVQAFDANLLITDRQLTQSDTMSLADVYSFLQKRGSALATLFLSDSAGLLKLPSEILWFAAQEARISPKVLLVMLQKEQSLVTASAPTNRQLDWAMGYGCPDSSGCNSRFQGFGKQVRGAALQLRGYLDDLVAKGTTIARWSIGQPKETSDGYLVTPRNAATAALYSYTPWRGSDTAIGGNYSFVKLWSTWFGEGRYPDGAVLRDPDGRKWLIRNDKRWLFGTDAVFRSRSADVKLVPVSRLDLEAYEQGGTIRFSNYAVVQTSDGIRWVLAGTTRRQVASSEVFRQLGFHPDEIERASSDDLLAYDVGQPIETSGDDPRGVLVREIGSNIEYVVRGSTKYPIVHESIRIAYYGDAQPDMRPRVQLAKLATGDPIRFPDGELVTSPSHLPLVFIISRGKRRPFATSRILEQLGYSWSNLTMTTDAALNLHLDGDEVTGGFEAMPTVISSPPSPTRHTVPPNTEMKNTPGQLKGLSLF